MTESGELDAESLHKLLERNIQHGIDGVFILGSMGEWRSCSPTLRSQLIDQSVKAIAGRIELLVGITDHNLEAALTNMRQAAKHPFDSYVFMLPPSGQCTDPVKTVLRILDEADRPVYYYHCPPGNQQELVLEQFKEIMQHPKLKGIKNSASNMMLRRELLLLKAEMGANTILLEGQEWAVDEALMVGYDGMLCGMGALASGMMVALAKAVDLGDITAAIECQNRMIKLFHGIYGSKLESVWAGQKYALKLLGLCSSAYTAAQPMTVLTEERKAQIAQCLEEFKGYLE